MNYLFASAFLDYAFLEAFTSTLFLVGGFRLKFGLFFWREITLLPFV